MKFNRSFGGGGTSKLSRLVGKSKRYAFTLTELVITMLVIAVIVGVSIKLTKAKLDNITSYTYYSAYSTLNSVTKEMLKDYDASSPDYASFFDVLMLRAFAAQDCLFVDYQGNCYSFTSIEAGELAGESLSVDDYMGRYYGEIQEYGDMSYSDLGWSNYKSLHPDYKDQNLCVWDRGLSSCGDWNLVRGCDPTAQGWFNSYTFYTCFPTGYTLVFYKVPEDPEDQQPSTPPDSPEPDPTPCEAGKVFDEASNSCVCANSAPEVIPCGKEWSDTECKLVDKTSFPPVCSAGQWFNNDDLVCDCVPNPPTIPPSGANYCKLFANYANTSVAQAFRECNGTRIGANETDFSDKTPDIILRNGIRLYNVSQNPEQIDILSGNSKGKTYTDADGNPVDIDEWGYTLYIDIDGSRGGNGRLWEDVYPFYVTLSGAVIPAYDIANPSLSGGDSRQHLQISVHDEFIENSVRRTQWVTKSSSFKHSACAMGYVNAATRYCATPPAVAANPQCAVQGHDCRLKTVMPVKFFGR